LRRPGVRKGAVGDSIADTGGKNELLSAGKNSGRRALKELHAFPKRGRWAAICIVIEDCTGPDVEPMLPATDKLERLLENRRKQPRTQRSPGFHPQPLAVGAYGDQALLIGAVDGSMMFREPV
jgi:hypothetical protein